MPTQRAYLLSRGAELGDDTFVKYEVVIQANTQQEAVKIIKGNLALRKILEDTTSELKEITALPIYTKEGRVFHGWSAIIDE